MRHALLCSALLLVSCGQPAEPSTGDGADRADGAVPAPAPQLRELDVETARLARRNRALQRENAELRDTIDELLATRAASVPAEELPEGPETPPPPRIDTSTPAGAAVGWLHDVDPKGYGALTPAMLPELTALELRGKKLTADDLRHLSALTALEFLDLRGSVDDELLRHLPRLTSLRTLRLRGRGITDEGVALLFDLPALEELDLTEARITPGTIANLPRRSHLTRLRLNRVVFDDGDIELLAGMRAIEHLEIDGTGVTDRGLMRIGALFPSLGRLEIRDTDISAAAVNEFRRLHPDCDVAQR